MHYHEPRDARSTCGSRVEQWLEATRWSDALAAVHCYPAMKLLLRSARQQLLFLALAVQ